MASRDYLIRQIEEMGFFLASLLRRILKMKEENQQEQMESAVRESLFQKLELNIDQAVVLEEQDFLNLVKEHFTSEEQLEKLADILKVLGQEKGLSLSLTKINYLQKSLFLFTHLQESSANFSFERREKILEIQELLRLQGMME